MPCGDLGYPDQALTRSHEALALAEEHAHPFSQAIALAYAVMLHQFRREQHTVYEHAETALTLCTEQGLCLLSGVGNDHPRLVVAEQGQREEGIEQMRQGLRRSAELQGTRKGPTLLSRSARRGVRNSRADGRGTTRPCRGLCRQWTTTGERRWEAELHRRKGELLLQGAGRRRQAAGDTRSVFPSGA